MSIKSIVKDLTPPMILREYQRLTKKTGFCGSYETWEDAVKVCNRNSTSFLEKDGKIHSGFKDGSSSPELWAWPLLAGLTRASLERQGVLVVLDFGGGLGVNYFAFRKFCPSANVHWFIVEMPSVAQHGRQYLESDDLKFFENVADALGALTPDVIICAGVLQCLPKPYDVLTDLVRHGSKYFFLDRTPTLKGLEEKVMVQRFPSHTGGGAAPVRLLSETRIMDCMFEQYDLLGRHNWGSPDVLNIADYQCFLFGRK